MYVHYIVMSFEENIKKWVLLDNQQKHLNEKIKEIRNQKTNLNDNSHKSGNYFLWINCLFDTLLVF